MLTAVTLVLSGCVSTRNAGEPEIIVPEQSASVFEEAQVPPELQSIKNKKAEGLEKTEISKGVVFAKTVFEGLLETRYVEFLFEDLDEPDHKFQVHIGEKTNQPTFPWEVKNVEPGYFFLELPEGRYKIASVTIPVGTASATETMDVTLEVIHNAVTYVGTLKMVGTKEKFKLGGVPVIKPGFEYTVEVIDERDEGAEAFNRNYPNFPHGVSIKLMEVNEHPIIQDGQAEK